MADFIVVASLICERMDLTSTRMISPTLGPGGTVMGMLSSSADHCDVCDGPVEILELTPTEAFDLTEMERSLYALR